MTRSRCDADAAVEVAEEVEEFVGGGGLQLQVILFIQDFPIRFALLCFGLGSVGLGQWSSFEMGSLNGARGKLAEDN